MPQSAPQAESRYVVKRVPDGTIQVDWIRVGTVGGLDWLDCEVAWVEAEFTNQCTVWCNEALGVVVTVVAVA